ncbi:NAD(P)H-dependent oxidoreductase [uncultured Bartonella sp.]|uniref:NADPH-dependent FMN reductase n=1 Tax=uncultured Bartonella sp. TaxID=104108 RepID=UPI00261F33EC|nr:NAD(P)H-dependent oxidoreductase [uncultured Bartonella sp.]
MKPLLEIIVTPTRAGRVGRKLGDWLYSFAVDHSNFDVELIDLAEVNLPMFDEPKHPRLHQYEHAHTKTWSKLVAKGDIYIFVMPEYDHLPPSSFINAVTYLSNEWNYKAASFLSYGGISGGLRAVETARLMLNAVRMVPILESITIPQYLQYINEDGDFRPNSAIENGAQAVFDELFKVNNGLRTIRPKF